MVGAAPILRVASGDMRQLAETWATRPGESIPPGRGPAVPRTKSAEDAPSVASDSQIFRVHGVVVPFFCFLFGRPPPAARPAGAARVPPAQRSSERSAPSHPARSPADSARWSAPVRCAGHASKRCDYHAVRRCLCRHASDSGGDRRWPESGTVCRRGCGRRSAGRRRECRVRGMWLMGLPLFDRSRAHVNASA